MPSDRQLRLIIAGGGTGGHVLPAVATLQELRARGIGVDALWIGSFDGVEGEAAAREGIDFAAIPTGKLRRYLDVKSARDAANIPRGYWAAKPLIRAFRPDVVLSTGGFVSVPTVRAARRQAPILTHEQTTIIGLATRINLRSADVLALSFDNTLARVGRTGCRSVVTGNPIRSGLFDGSAERARTHYGFDSRLPVIYVTGGARGASPLNRRIMAVLPRLLERTQVVHQTGPASANSDAAELAAIRSSLPPKLQRRYVVTEFVRDELADLFALADLVIGRAGAGTVAELAALGKASILVPLPLSGGGEQIVNARALASRSASICLLQDEASPDRLLGEITSLLDAPAERARMAEAARLLGRPDAAARLVDELLALAGRRTA
jgi:UDP-N-acetylglucosamine--N-acetylmuramyl-(pentapeptide) pyrophosphoryl-undecaprenol N-acetylglucosamine transferase